MNKRILQIFILLLAVVFLTTAAYAGVNKHKNSWRWWKNPFGSLWSAVIDLQGQVNALNAELNNKVMSADVKVGPQGPKGDKGDPGPIGPQGLPGKDAPMKFLICGGCSFSESTQFVGYDFRNAYLYNALMQKATMTGADFTDANLELAYMVQANLKNAVMVRTNLANARLGGAVLECADLSGADLTGVQWESYWWDPIMQESSLLSAQCPDGTWADQNGGTCENNLGPPPGGCPAP